MSFTQRIRLFTAWAVSTLFVFASLLPTSPVFAETGPNDETNVMEDDACWTWAAGVVDNRSSFTMQIKGNLEEGGQAQTYQLYAGQQSEDDTNMCDVDEVNVQQDHWYLWYWRNSSSWVKIYSWNLDCYTWNSNDYGNVVRCAAIWMNPGEPEPAPPAEIDANNVSGYNTQAE